MQVSWPSLSFCRIFSRLSPVSSWTAAMKCPPTPPPPHATISFALFDISLQIASVVFPDAQVPQFALWRLIIMLVSSLAQVKIFLNASSSVRAQRRHAELDSCGHASCHTSRCCCDIESRDAADYSRPVGALREGRSALSPSAALSFRWHASPCRVII
jgi:hypothetical protein